MKKSEIKNIAKNGFTLAGLTAGLGFSAVATEALMNFAKPFAPKGSSSVIKWFLFGLGAMVLMDAAGDTIVNKMTDYGELAGTVATQFIGEPDEESTEESNKEGEDE